MNELTKSERLLLEAMQIEDSPRIGDADRVKQRVLMGVGVAAAAGAAATMTTAAEAAAGSSPLAAPAAAAIGLGSSSAVTTAASTSTFGLMKALLVVGSVAGLGGGAVLWSWENAEPVKPAATESSLVEVPEDSSERPISPTSAAPVHAADNSEEVAEPLQEAAPDKAAPKAAAVSSKKPIAPSKKEDTVSRLKEEAQLLRKAQVALQGGDAGSAISVLAEHKKKFPSGVLSGEREAALSVAYCMSGDLARGRAGAERFVANNPNSPMVQRLKSACKLSME